MGEFYVSDAFTLTPVTAPKTVHYPGPFNSSTVWGPNAQVYVEFEAGELGFTAFVDSIDGMAMDIQLGFYDVSTPGVATPYGPPIPFAPPFGTASNGQVMNAEGRCGRYTHATRYPKRPIKFQGGTSPSVAATQIGAIVTFHYGASTPVTVQYQHFMQGTCS